MPAKFLPASVSFVSADEGWVLGTAPCAKPPCTSIVRTRDGGKTWQGVPAPRADLDLNRARPPADNTVRLIRFADQSNGWAAGRALYATHDGGSTWHNVAIGTATTTINSIGTAAGRAYAATTGCAGGKCAGGIAVYSAAIGSDSWTKVFTLPSQVTGLAELAVDDSGWYLPTGKGIYHGIGAGRAVALPNPCQVEVTEGGTIRYSPELAVADAKHLDAMCTGDPGAGSTRYQLFGTSDGGQHWKAAGPGRQEMDGLNGLADNRHGVLLVGISGATSAVLRSTDDGASLPTALTADSGYGWTDLGFTTPEQAVVVQRGKALYLSRNVGASWSPVKF